LPFGWMLAVRLDACRSAGHLPFGWMLAVRLDTCRSLDARRSERDVC
jgi:hypothetical protein